MAESNTGGRNRRKWLVVVAVVLIAGAVLIALTPMILSAGIAASILAGAVEEQLAPGNTVAIDDVSLSWTGGQQVQNLTITDSNGLQAVAADAELQQSLFSIIFGSRDRFDITLQGQGVGELYADGTTSFHRLIPEDDEPLDLSNLPTVHIDLNNTTIELRDETAQRTVMLSDVVGEAQFGRGVPIDVELTSPIQADDLQGELDLQAVISGLIAANGDITPAGATVDVQMTSREFPVPFDRQGHVLQQLSLSAKSDDLTRRLLVQVHGSSQLQLPDDAAPATDEDDPATQLDAELVIASPFNAAGEVTITPAAITGTIIGTNVPTSLVQPMLAQTPFVLADDVGDVVNIDATFGEGEQRDVDVQVAAEHLDMHIRGNIEHATQRLAIDDGSIRTRIRPQLFERLTVGAVTIREPAELNATIDQAVFPGVNEQGERPLGEITFAATASVSGTTNLIFANVDDRGANAVEDAADGDQASETIVPIENLQLSLSSPGLAETIDINGGAGVAGGSLAIDLAIAGAIDAQGDFAADQLLPGGTVRLENVRSDAVVAMVGAMPAGAEHLLGEVLTLNIEAQTPAPGELLATASFTSGQTSLNASARRTEDALQMQSIAARMQVTPEFVQQLQQDRDEPIVMMQPATIAVEVDEFVMTGRGFAEYSLPDEPIRATIVSEQPLQLDQVPGVERALALVGLRADVTAASSSGDDDVMRFTLDGTAALQQVDPNTDIADIAFEFTGEAAEAMALRGRLQLDDLVSSGLEQLLAMESGTISRWTGEQLDVALNIEQIEPHIDTVIAITSDRISGAIAAAMEDQQRVKITSVTGLEDRTSQPLAILVTAEAMNEMLVVEGPGAEPSPTLAEDVTLQVAIDDLLLPLAMFGDEPIEADSFGVDIQLSGGPAVINNPDGTQSRLETLTASLTSDSLGDGIRFSAHSRTQPAETEETGLIDISGTLTGLLNESSMLDLANASIDTESRITNIPTAFVDALFALDGLLTATLGPTTTAVVVTNDFSTSSGKLAAEVSSTYGQAEASLVGRDHGVAIAGDDHIHAELQYSDSMRERLLSRLNPLLGDIQRTAEPITFTMPEGYLPLDDGLSRLNGRFTLNLGAFQMNTQRSLLGLVLRLSQEEQTVPGSVGKITASITDGVVRYEPFDLTVDKQTLRIAGSVDLVNRKVDLTSGIALAGLKHAFRELDRLPDDIIVPLRWTGSLDDPKPGIPQDWLARMAVEHGIRGLLEREAGGTADDILKGIDDIFGGKRKEKPEREDEDK